MSVRIGISIALALGVVNGAAAATGAGFRKLRARLEQEPLGTYLKSDVADSLGIERAAPARGLTVDVDDAADGQKHMADLILKDGKPLCIIFNVKKKENNQMDARLIRVSLSGRIEKAVREAGKYGDDGKPIRGTGVLLPLDPNAPETRADLQHELDFWIRDKYRKSRAVQP